MNGIELELMQFPMVRAEISASRDFDKCTITLLRRLLVARDLTTFTVIADFYTVELILYRKMCGHFETGFAPNPDYVRLKFFHGSLLFVGTR